MRRTSARALSVAALAGTVLGTAAAAASADPAAEVSPGTVSPGGSVTVSVSCDTSDGSAPATIEATSQAFEDGIVELKRASGDDAAYSGSARVPPAENLEDAPESDWTVDGTCPAAAGGEGKEWSATFKVARESGGEGSGGGKGDLGGSGGREEGGGPTCTEPDSDWSKSEAGQSDPGQSDPGRGDPGRGDPGRGDPGRGETGIEPTAPGWDSTGTGKSDPQWSEGESHAEDCGSASTEHGVQAGTGGTFTDSVPALVAGGLLIAGAAGGAVYRLRRRTPDAED